MSDFGALTSVDGSHLGSHRVRRCDADRTSPRILPGPGFCLHFILHTPGCKRGTKVGQWTHRHSKSFPHQASKFSGGLKPSTCEGYHCVCEHCSCLGVRPGAMAPTTSVVRCPALVVSLPPRSHLANEEGERCPPSPIAPHRTAATARSTGSLYAAAMLAPPFSYSGCVSNPLRGAAAPCMPRPCLRPASALRGGPLRGAAVHQSPGWRGRTLLWDFDGLDFQVLDFHFFIF